MLRKRAMLLTAGAALGITAILLGAGIHRQADREGLWILKELGKALEEKEEIIDYAMDGSRAFLLVGTGKEEPDYGDLFLVLEREDSGEWARMYENDFTGLKPWKLELGDVDGDGMIEIVTAVRKTTYYDREERNRLFVFNYGEAGLVKKWTGSQIAGNWTDFEIGDLVSTRGEEIVFLSRTKEGRDKLFVYAWYDFGFLMLAQSEEYQEITGVGLCGENRIRLTHGQGKEYLMLRNNQIVRAE